MVDWIKTENDREDSFLINLHFIFTVNYRDVSSQNLDFLRAFKSVGMQHEPGQKHEKDKYDHEFFNIAPLYHLAFTNLDKFIFLDCFDLGE